MRTLAMRMYGGSGFQTKDTAKWQEYVWCVPETPRRPEWQKQNEGVR